MSQFSSVVVKILGSCVWSAQLTNVAEVWRRLFEVGGGESGGESFFFGGAPCAKYTHGARELGYLFCIAMCVRGAVSREKLKKAKADFLHRHCSY